MANEGLPEAPRLTSIENDSSAVHKVRKVYLKDLSFESPNSPAVFTDVYNKDHQMQIDVQVAHTALDDDAYEVTIRLTLHAHDGHENTICLIEVVQAGGFDFPASSEQALEPYLKIHCPRVLYPFVRRHIWSLIYEGGFPTLLMQDFDFEVMNKIVANP